jgi:hypothetical protein
MIKYVAYSQLAHAWMMPGGFVKFLRTCVAYQFFKLVYYNYKIIKVINKGH